MANKVTTLIDADNNDQLYPRTKASAVSDSAGNSIEDSLMYHDSGTSSSGTTPINADQLGGYSASDYVRTDAVDEVAYYSADTVASGVKTVRFGGWELAGSANADGEITLPSDFSELLVHVNDGEWLNMTMFLNKEILTNSRQVFHGGAYYTSSSNSGWYVWATLSYVKTNNLNSGSVDRLSDSVTTVYYR